MAKLLIEKESLVSIADGFRASRGLTESLTLARMAALAAESVSGEEIAPIPDVPSYVKEEANAVASAVRSVQTPKTLTFAAMSDTHIGMALTSTNAEKTRASAEMAGQGLSYLRNILPVHAAFVLGDLTWSDDAYSVQQVKDDWSASVDRLSVGFRGLPSAWTAGNHEINYGIGRERTMTEGELYAYLGANSKGWIAPDGKCYGYMDFPIQKIRVIVVNTADTLGEYPESDTSVKAKSEWVGAEQLQWLASTALNFSDKSNPAEWGIVVCSHHPLAYGGQSGIGRSLQILEAYRDGKSGSITYTSDKSHTVTYDFTSGAKAEIICNVHGHSHNFVYKKRSSNSSTGGNVAPWLWSICVPCINCGRENEHATNEYLKDNYGDFDASGNPVYYYKTSGTRNGTSFCIFTIDREKQTVYAHKFGAGTDRVVGYSEEDLAVYKVTSNLTYCTLSNSTVSVVEGNAYSATVMANSGYVLDSVTITMGGTNITSTAYADGKITIESVTGDIVITAVAEEIPLPYTNVLKTAGYNYNGRLSSSTGAFSADSTHQSTGFIPCKVGDTIRFANIQGLVVADSHTKRFCFYNTAEAFIAQRNVTSTELGKSDHIEQFAITYDSNGDLVQMTIPSSYVAGGVTTDLSATAYIRFCTKKGGITDASIVTVNEEIA